MAAAAGIVDSVQPPDDIDVKFSNFIKKRDIYRWIAASPSAGIDERYYQLGALGGLDQARIRMENTPQTLLHIPAFRASSTKGNQPSESKFARWDDDDDRNDLKSQSSISLGSSGSTSRARKRKAPQDQDWVDFSSKKKKGKSAKGESSGKERKKSKGDSRKGSKKVSFT